MLNSGRQKWACAGSCVSAGQPETKGGNGRASFKIQTELLSSPKDVTPRLEGENININESDLNQTTKYERSEGYGQYQEVRPSSKFKNFLRKEKHNE